MRHLCYAFIILLVLASCRDKVICPTFQSTYILDDSVRNTYFSYLWYLNDDDRNNYLASKSEKLPPDSLGVMVASADEGAVEYFAYTADYKVLPRQPKRTKYGIAKKNPVIPTLVKNQQLKTSPRENVLTPPVIEKEEKPESIPTDSSAYAPLDSTAYVAQTDSLSTSQPIDSTAVAKTVEKKKKAPWEPFRYGFIPTENMQPDQEYYFRKYGWLLQNAPQKQDADGEAADSTGTVQKKGFFKNLFQKKDKGEREPKEKKVKEKKVKEPKEGPTEENSEGTIPEEDDTDEGFE